MTDTPVYLSYNVDIPSLSLGALAADSALPAYVTNPAGSVAQSSYWTSVATKYASATTVLNWIFKSKPLSIDQEIDIWGRNCRAVLRLDDSGKAIYFQHNGETTNGTLEIGIATGLDETTSVGTVYYPLYSNSNLVGTVPGYTKIATDDQYFTFGVSGLDIFAKYNGVEFCRFRDYRHYCEGTIAVRGVAAGYGVRTFGVRHCETKSIYSDPADNIIDMRDYDVREVVAVGSIGAASNSLGLARKANFKVADWVIVETGGEAGAGLRGTHGVGGTWPAQSYVDTATLQADLTKPHQTYAWAEDTGNVWQYSATLTVWLAVAPTRYYTYKAIPLALQARITAISADGLTLTLDTNAVVTATNANVYLNNSPMLDLVLGRQRASPGLLADYRPITPDGMKIILPNHRLAICNYVNMDEKVRWEVVGSPGCEVWSPKGTPCAGWWLQNSDRCFVKYVDLTGNHGLNGFALDMVPGIQWGGYRADGSINPYFRTMSNSQTAIGQGAGYTRGYFLLQSADCEVWDCLVTDVFQFAFGTSFSPNCWGRRIYNRQNVGFQQYIQWQFLCSDGDNCGTEDCTVDCPEVIAGFSSFKSTNARHTRLKAFNAVCEMNDAAGTFDNPYIRITGQLSPSVSASVPLININTNIGGTARSDLGTTIINPIMIQDDYVTASKDILAGIVVNSSNRKISSIGGRYQSKDFDATATLTKGAMAVNSAGADTLIDGLMVIGTTKPGSGWANIHIIDGSGRAINCKANEIKADNLPRKITAATNTAYDGNEVIVWAGTANGELTLPTPTGRGRSLLIRSTCAFALNSASANVEPLVGGALGTAILPAGAGKWARLEDTGFIASTGFVKRWMIVEAG